MAFKDLGYMLIIKFLLIHIFKTFKFVILQYFGTVAFEVRDSRFPFIFHIYYETRIQEEIVKAKNMED